MSLTDSELQQLASFRRAARQVREASIIADGQDIEIRAEPGDPGYVDIFVKLLENERFRSMALAIRLVYQQGEPGNFLSVCNVLCKELPETRGKVAALRAQYLSALRDDANRISISDGNDPSEYSAEAVFETWLYGIAFHQDTDRQADVARLEAEGTRFLWAVQAISLQLAGRILDLDDVIADVTGQERLRRIDGQEETLHNWR